MIKNSSKFFANRECEYFPCHAGADPEAFSCLFCYCPLYALGKKCGGNFKIIDGGIKDCSECRFPHMPDSYSAVVSRFGEIAEAVSKLAIFDE